MNSLLTKRNIIGAIVLVTLLVGLLLATRLTQIQQILRSHAAENGVQLDPTNIVNTTVESQHIQEFSDPGDYHITGSVSPHAGGHGNIQVDVYDVDSKGTYTYNASAGVAGTQDSAIDKTLHINQGQHFFVIDRVSIGTVDFHNVALMKMTPSPVDDQGSISTTGSWAGGAAHEIGTYGKDNRSLVANQTFQFSYSGTGHIYAAVINGTGDWEAGSPYDQGTSFTVTAGDYIQLIADKNGASNWSNLHLSKLAEAPVTLNANIANTTVNAQHIQELSGPGHYHIIGSVSPHAGGHGHIQVDVYDVDSKGTYTFNASAGVAGAEDTAIDAQFDVAPGQHFFVIDRATTGTVDFHNVTLTKNTDIPLPSTVSYPNGTVTCDSNNRATFSWTALNYPGKTVQGYEVRINAAPAAWGPDTNTPIDQPTVTQRADSGPDRALNVPASQTSVTVQLVPGQYLDWVAQPGFTDGTVLSIEDPNGWGHWGAFTCSGNTTPSQSPSPSSSPSQSSAPSSPAAVTVVKYRLSESSNGLDTTGQYEERTDYQPGITLDHTFAGDAATAGIKTLFVRFYYSDGSTSQSQQSLSYVPQQQLSLGGISCITDPSNPNGTQVITSGSGFGDTVGSLTLAGQQSATISSGQWTDSQVTASFPSKADGSQTVVLTTTDGRTVSGTCTLNKIQVSVNVALTCKTVNRPPQTAVAQIVAASNSAVVYPATAVTFDSQGNAQNILPSGKLVSGQTYLLEIASKFTLTRVISFVASALNTSVINENPVQLPLGDIAPAGGDGAINNNDAATFRTQLSQLQDVTKQADFNVDGRVNALDWACLRSNFNKQSDSISAADAAALNASGS